MSVSANVVAYLASLGHLSNIKPVSVTISGVTYEGAEYDRTNTYTAEMDGVRRGQFKAGDTYTDHAIYLVGALPAYRLRSNKTCFTFEGDARDWYIASYMKAENLSPQNAEFHPFGVTFMLMPWDLPSGEKIDHYEEKPYVRVKARKEESA